MGGRLKKRRRIKIRLEANQGFVPEIQHRALSDIDGVSNKPFHPRPEPVAAGLAGLPGRFTIISETHNSQEMGAIRLKNLINSGTCGHKEVGYLVE